jgi:hypothetical protein
LKTVPPSILGHVLALAEAHSVARLSSLPPVASRSEPSRSSESCSQRQRQGPTPQQQPVRVDHLEVPGHLCGRRGVNLWYWIESHNDYENFIGKK